MVSSFIYTLVHPTAPLLHPPTKETFHLINHLLKGTSSILVVRLLSPHIPIMAHSIPSHSRGVRSRGSLIPIAHRRISIRGRITILVDWRLTTNSGRISSVARAHVSRGSVCWERIGILVSISPVLWLALPELALGSAGGVPVVWGWTKGALLATVLDQEEFEEDGDEEEDASDNCDGESSLLESASSSQAWQDGNTAITSNDIVVQVGVSVSVGGSDESRA